ncbi:MAG: hypothetical protein K0V04_15355 [Deltaproteobacteria bacterium]|nr:hypothetical protein [Deltaproteobacteria bacterium]
MGLILTVVGCDPDHEEESFDDMSEGTVIVLRVCDNDEWVEQYIDCRNADLDAPSSECFESTNAACSGNSQ